MPCSAPFLFHVSRTFDRMIEQKAKDDAWAAATRFHNAYQEMAVRVLEQRQKVKGKRRASRRRLCVVFRSRLCSPGSNAGDRGIAASQIRSALCRYRRANCATWRTFSSSKQQDRQILRASSGLRSTNYQAKSRITYLCQSTVRPGYKPRIYRA